jgi:hypothetical protein
MVAVFDAAAQIPSSGLAFPEQAFGKAGGGESSPDPGGTGKQISWSDALFRDRLT